MAVNVQVKGQSWLIASLLAELPEEPAQKGYRQPLMDDTRRVHLRDKVARVNLSAVRQDGTELKQVKWTVSW
jgi:hypothetical protein